MQRSTNKNDKPKMIERNLHDVVLSWGNIITSDTESTIKLQLYNEMKEWMTIYWGKKTQFRVDNLAACICYNLRIKIDKPEADWVYFKAATEDDGPYSYVMHMTRAVKLGKMSLIRKIAHKRPHLLEAENRECKSPLIQAIEIGDIQILQLLITLGADVNTPQMYNKRTPLMIAVYKNKLQIAANLIDKGADVYATDINGLNVLHHAVDSSNIENVKFALQIGLDINCKDNQLWTPLLRAAILNISEEIIELLLKNGAKKNVKDKNGFNFEKHLSLT